MSEEYDQEDSNAYDDAERRNEVSQEVMEAYGSPVPEEKINQFKIFDKAIERRDTTRTTYLTKGELGKPLFSVRFYLNCYETAKSFNAPLIEKYFLKKAGVITNTGMSNEGFILKLSVSSNRTVKRTHVKSEDEKTKENTGE